MTIDSTTGSIRFTPSNSGTFPVSIQVTDALGQTATQTYNLTVNLQAALSPPVITTQPMTSALDGVPYMQTISAEDPQAFPIIYSLSVSAVGMTIDPQTGIISWLPSGVGSIPVVVVATDSAGLNAILGYTLTVHPDVAPTITSTPPTTATAGAPFAYEIEADGNGDTVSYSLAPTLVDGQSVPPPAGMTINSTTGLVTWNPTTANLGPQQVDDRRHQRRRPGDAADLYARRRARHHAPHRRCGSQLAADEHRLERNRTGAVDRQRRRHVDEPLGHHRHSQRHNDHADHPGAGNFRRHRVGHLHRHHAGSDQFRRHRQRRRRQRRHVDRRDLIVSTRRSPRPPTAGSLRRPTAPRSRPRSPSSAP